MEQTSGARGIVRIKLATNYAMPGYLLVIYAVLMLALGWFAHQRWGGQPPVFNNAQAMPLPSPIALPSAIPAPAASLTTDVSAPPLASAQNSTAASTENPDAPVNVPAKPARVVDGNLPALIYSAHVFTSDPDKRSITLNGVRYREGESPMDGLVIEQIQQEVTLFAVNGEVFILDALADWPGGDIREAN